MAHEKFVDIKFRRQSLRIISQAALIIEDYRNQGYVLTLRQLYYQFVARGLIENSVQSYKRLGSTINDARLAGLLDWDSIEDRTRNLKTASSWNSPASIIRSAAYSYNIDMWENQLTVPEVWIEKDALVGVAERACKKWDIPLYACRGYSSQSEQYKAGKRIEERQSQGKHTVIIHLGDHDPSGLDMTRDNRERLSMFAGLNVHLVRVALNMDQVEKYNPPPNPAKETDSRSPWYIKNYGDESWELDALDPATINALIEETVVKYIDMDQWGRDDENRMSGRDLIHKVANNWDTVKKTVEAI